MMKYKLLLLRSLALCLLLYTLPARAQEEDTAIWENIVIDEYVVTAMRNGFSIESFIKTIKNDTTFYKAFKTMRLKSFNAENHISCYDKKGRIKAQLKSETKQIYRNGCRSMLVLDEQSSGDFYDRKKRYNYFTAQMYAGLFFTEDTVCGENNIVKGSLSKELSGLNRIEKSKVQLKQLMFNPGTAIPGLPFIGHKIGIFEPDVAQMYHFSLVKEDKNGVACYKFTALPKEEYKNKVVINSFVTWLRISDYSILARSYSLSYKALGYDFDVSMYVTLMQKGKELLPSHINYDGDWKIVTKSREKVKFKADFSYL